MRTVTYNDNEWRLVPVVATPQMEDACRSACANAYCDADSIFPDSVWQAMLEAAPQPSEVVDESSDTTLDDDIRNFGSCFMLDGVRVHPSRVKIHYSLDSTTSKLEEWLMREIPPGTVISNPSWWAKRIARQFSLHQPSVPVARVMSEAVAQLDYTWLSRDGFPRVDWFKNMPPGKHQLFAHPQPDAARDADADADADELAQLRIIHANGITEDMLCQLLPGNCYMDPPDGVSVSVYEQLSRMAKDASRYRWLLVYAESIAGLRINWYTQSEDEEFGSPDMSLQEDIDAAMAAGRGEVG